MLETDSEANENQRRLSDVPQLFEEQQQADSTSVAPAAKQPAGRRDEKASAIVDPVSGAAL